MSKFFKILIQLIPIILMIALIPLIKNDYWLTGVDLAIIIIALVIKYGRRDWIFLIFGFFGMMLSEYVFISTGTETFNRNSLFGLMPLWLPFLWAYGFIVIRRTINILETGN